MLEEKHIPDLIYSNSPLRKIVHFDETVSIPPQSTTSINLLTASSSTASLSFPLLAEKPGIRFKLLILLLSLLLALIIGFLLSVILVTQLSHIPTHTSSSSQDLLSKLSKQNSINNNTLFEQFDSIWVNQLDFNSNICEDFYGFICRKWLINHPLSPLEFKRSWLTEQSNYIRNNFAKILANLSEIHVYNQQLEIEKNQTEEIIGETEHDYYGGITQKNELEQFYSSFPGGYDDEPHKLVKRQSNFNEHNYSQSVSNMLLFYDQCLHTSKSVLVEELQQLFHDHFWFTTEPIDINSTTDNFDLFFEQMVKHPLMHLWNINTINLGTQIIIHIQRQIQNQEKLINFHEIEQAHLFEHYLQTNHINLCSQSSRVGHLSNTLKEYKDLLISSLIYSNSTINDDLHDLILNKKTLPIIYSSIKRSNDLHDLIQFMFDRYIIQSLNNTDLENLFSNFTNDLKTNLLNIPIFRSTITYQCQLYLDYYIKFRSLNHPEIETWIDYISSSIIHLIVHSWPGDASYICLYTTIVRHKQFQIIPYWNKFQSYIKKQINQYSSPMITIEIRLVDFFQIDSIFRFLFADQYGHYCNLMVYKYGPKLLPFISVFHQGIQISLKSLRRQVLQENSKEHHNLPSFRFPFTRIPNDCLTLLEYYYPYTLSSFYEEYMSNKTSELYFVAYELRDILLNNSISHQFLSTLQFHIKSERLKLFAELSSTIPNIPYEYYSIEDTYLSTGWNIIENFSEELIVPIHEFFEINGYHTISQGIFLQPTVAELYSNSTTRLIALLLIAHELGHALCPCGSNLNDKEYFADLIALRLIIDYNQQILNSTITIEYLRTFFLLYGQSECTHINREMLLFMNKQENLIEYHVNRVLKDNELFQTVFNCSLNQQKNTKKFNSLLPELCTVCRNNKKD